MRRVGTMFDETTTINQDAEWWRSVCFACERRRGAAWCTGSLGFRVTGNFVPLSRRECTRGTEVRREETERIDDNEDVDEARRGEATRRDATGRARKAEGSATSTTKPTTT